MAVCANVGAVAIALGDDGANLGFRILASLQRIGRGYDAPGAHDFDVMRPFAQLLASGLDALVHAVGVNGKEVALRSTGAVIGRLHHRPKVAVPAGLRKTRATVEKTRPIEKSIAQRHRHAVIATGDVPY